MQAGELIGDTWRNPLEVPPRYAVLGADNRGVFADHRFHLLRNLGYPVRLDADEDDIYGTGFSEITHDSRVDFKVEVGTKDPQAAFLHRSQVRAARVERDILAGASHQRADVAADRTGACDQGAHCWLNSRQGLRHSAALDL